MADNLGTYHIATYATTTPERPAIILGRTGGPITYRELEQRSRKLAWYLSVKDVGKDDHIAIMMANGADYLTVCWAAQRLGAAYTPINWHLAAHETAYI